MNEPRHAYVGIAIDGTLQLVLSREVLDPIGARLQQGTRFPAAVFDLYDESIPISREVIVSAVRGLEAFMAGEEYQAHTLTFGQPTYKPRRKRS
jgi:hypothetical protein